MAREQFSHAGVLRQTPGKLRFSEQNGTDLSQRGPVSTEKYTKLYDAMAPAESEFSFKEQRARVAFQLWSTLRIACGRGCRSRDNFSIL
jgi:hypothetical protein